MKRDTLFKELDDVEHALQSISPKVSSYKRYIERKKHLIKLIEKSVDKIIKK